MAIVLKAHAKINLHLDIGPRRQDGYHDLKTLFQEIFLHDLLTFQLTEGPIKLTSTPNAPLANDNIVVKALLLLKKHLKTNKGIAVHLEKKIPMGAGLGGGSADAAAALKAGWVLWKNKHSVAGKPMLRVPPILMKCAKNLGADVPFFLKGGRAWAEGIGEKLNYEPSIKKRWLVLVYPRVHVSTPEAYRLWDQSRTKTTRPSQWDGSFEGSYFNSFESVIFKKYPAIAAVHHKLNQLGCTEVMMSGSGSSVYGFVKSAAQGSMVVNKLQNKPWDVFLTYTR